MRANWARTSRPSPSVGAESAANPSGPWLWMLSCRPNSSAQSGRPLSCAALRRTCNCCSAVMCGAYDTVAAERPVPASKASASAGQRLSSNRVYVLGVRRAARGICMMRVAVNDQKLVMNCNGPARPVSLKCAPQRHPTTETRHENLLDAASGKRRDRLHRPQALPVGQRAVLPAGGPERHRAVLVERQRVVVHRPADPVLRRHRTRRLAARRRHQQPARGTRPATRGGRVLPLAADPHGADALRRADRSSPGSPALTTWAGPRCWRWR